jgi:hypothetical protein
LVPIPVGVTRLENGIEVKFRLVIQHLLHTAEYISSVVLSSRVKVEGEVNQTKSEKDDAAHTD